MNLIGQTVFLDQVIQPKDSHWFKGRRVKRASFARDKQQCTEVFQDWRLNISSTKQCLLPLFVYLTGIIHPSIIPSSSFHLPIHHHPYIHKYIRFLSPLMLPLGWREAGANPSCLMLRAELHFGLRKKLSSLEQGWLVERMPLIQKGWVEHIQKAVVCILYHTVFKIFFSCRLWVFQSAF